MSTCNAVGVLYLLKEAVIAQGIREEYSRLPGGSTGKVEKIMVSALVKGTGVEIPRTDTCQEWAFGNLSSFTN